MGPLHFDYHQSFQESLVMIPMESQRLQQHRIRRCFSWIFYPKFQQAAKCMRSCASSFLACFLICFIFIFRTYLSTVHFRDFVGSYLEGLSGYDIMLLRIVNFTALTVCLISALLLSFRLCVSE